MKLAESLANRLKEVLIEGKWVTGTNFKEQIFDLDWKEAIQKVDSINSIADLTFHISYYIAGVAKVLEGGSLDIKDKYSFDYPPVRSNEDWKNLINKFCSDSEKFIYLVAKMTDKELFKNFVDEKYGDYHRNIDVIIEHTYYHLGQVLLIKKLIKNR
ncbi:DUF1572 domain-containing protein [Aquimarina megaterium]|uniref:DUF1572 domain-containing protein n=1 Tax=Aquimarina megaterium TaxID=1443666 RepID=UPI0009452063|nr:DUF1572 domain-containing protein [Aquimarina megaterium]